MSQTITTSPTERDTNYRDYSGGYFKTLVTPEASNGAAAVIEMVLPQGTEPPLHIHTCEDEIFYLLEGEVNFLVGDTNTLVKAGEAAFAPRLIPHTFSILSNQAKFITIITPGNFWNYFMEFSSPTVGTPMITQLQGPPPAEVINRLTERLKDAYGVTMP